MIIRSLVAILGYVLLIGNAHAETLVEDEIARSVNDPCGSKLELLVTGLESAPITMVSCKGCSLLWLRDGYSDTRERFHEAIRESGAVGRDVMTFIQIFFEALETAFRQKWGFGPTDYSPVLFSDQAWEMGLCEEDTRFKVKEERKRKEEAERLLAEQKLKEQLAAEQEARLAAETEKAAANALSAAAGRIRSSIEANWRRPGASLRGLKVVIELRVGRNGEVQNARIVESSGDTSFDKSAELAVKEASPLPIPKEPEYYDHIKEFRIEFNPDE